jgi:hypothetical protein
MFVLDDSKHVKQPMRQIHFPLENLGFSNLVPLADAFDQQSCCQFSTSVSMSF